MKRTILTFLAAAASLPAASFVHEMPLEFSATGDFNGDTRPDVLIVDKASGHYRIGYGDTAGALIWAAARPTGVNNVTGVAMGKMKTTTADSFAVTAPAMNRVVLITPPGSGYVEPEAVLPAGVAPLRLASLDIPGAGATAHDDLACITTSNGAALRLRQIRCNGSAVFTSPGDEARTENTFSSLNPVLLVPGGETLLGAMLNDGTTDFRLLRPNGTATALMQSVDHANVTLRRFVCGNPDATSSYVFIAAPPARVITPYRFSVSGAAVAKFTGNTFTAAADLVQMMPLQDTNTLKLALLLTDGRVQIVRWAHGTNAWTVETVLTLTGGAAINGLQSVNSTRFMALYAAAAGQTSSSIQEWKFNGTVWQPQTVVPLSPLPSGVRSANVFLLDAPLFDADNAEVLRTYRTADWTTAASVGTGTFPVTAQAATFGGADAGLGTPSAQTLGTATAQPAAAVANQLHTQISLYSFSTTLGPRVEEVAISPVPGTYDHAVSLAFSGLSAGATVYFRQGNAGAYSLWNAASPPWLSRDVTIQFYAVKGGVSSVVRSAAYTFSKPPALQDRDADGVPDFVEIANGLNPAGGADSDGDGASDFDELQQGTNPLDANSHPAQTVAKAQGITVEATITLKGLAGATVDRAAAGTALQAYGADGALLASGEIGQGSTRALYGFMLPEVDDEVLVTFITAPNFDINAPAVVAARGREMAGVLLTMDPLGWTPLATDATYFWGTANWAPGSNNWQTGTGSPFPLAAGWSQSQTDPAWGDATHSAASWLAAYATARAAPAPKADFLLSPETTLGLLLIEQTLHWALDQRGAVPAGQRVSLTSWREIEQTAGSFAPGSALLRSLAFPDETNPDAPLLRTASIFSKAESVMNSTNAAWDSARRVAREIYRLGQQAPPAATPAAFASPLDTLRNFVRTGTLPADYLAAFGVPAGERTNAFTLISQFPASVARRTANAYSLVIAAAPPGQVLTQTAAAPFISYLLVDADGQAVDLTGLLTPEPGQPLTVLAYPDIPNIGGRAALEVISLTIPALHAPVGEDTDGDLLADAWELRMFGSLTKKGGDSDGTFHTLAHDYLDGTDPGTPRLPGAPPPPPLVLSKFDFTPALTSLTANWPPAYAGAVEVVFSQSPDLADWSDLGPGTGNAAGTFLRSIPAMNQGKRYYRAYVRLRQ